MEPNLCRFFFACCLLISVMSLDVQSSDPINQFDPATFERVFPTPNVMVLLCSII